MYRQLSKSSKLLRYNQICSIRTYLSESYKCSEAWNARLVTPILKNVNINQLYIDLEQKYTQRGKASAIDIDIFINSITDDSHLEEISDLVQKLRLTDETTSTLESTGHALIRNYIETDHIDQLIQILDDRLNFGVFLDNFTANILLDHLILKGNFKYATKVASLVMLQEDFSHPITKALSLYACNKYLENPEPFKETKEVPVDEPVVKKKKVDEIKVRVKFLRNAFFDDHFDITDNIHLTGKTILAIIADGPNEIQDSFKLLGLALYEKYNEANRILDDIVAAKKPVYQDTINKLKSVLNSRESAKEFLTKLEGLEPTLTIYKENVEQILINQVTQVINENEKQDVELQTKIYSSWVDERQRALDAELQRLKRAERLKEIEIISKDMAEEERKLWFFENEEKLDLAIENKKVLYPKKWFGKKKKPRVVDEGYIPPEITKHTKI